VVHALRDADREAACTARQRASVLRFDDEVHVIALNREMEDAKRPARSVSYRGTHEPKRVLRAQVRHVAARA
jgi:hypothetical protein